MQPEVFTTEAAEAYTEVDATGVAHSDPELWGQAPYQIVGWAMLLLILIMVWKKVPRAIIGGLDKKIADIRDQLDEAKKLRAEAEMLRDEYAAKIVDAEKDAEAMVEHARNEADAILVRAEEDSKVMIELRRRMAEDKIAGAERAALADVRERAAQAATTASRHLIAKNHSADSDMELADSLISSI